MLLAPMIQQRVGAAKRRRAALAEDGDLLLPIRRRALERAPVAVEVAVGVGPVELFAAFAGYGYGFGGFEGRGVGGRGRGRSGGG